MSIINKKHGKFLFPLSMLLFIVSCTTKPILITQNKLSISTVSLYQNTELFYTDIFLRFDFHSSLPPSDIGTKSLLQVRAVFTKDGKIVARGSAPGIFLVSTPNPNKKMGGVYSAYMLKSLKAYIDDSGNTIAIDKLNYDKFSIVIIHPTIAWADKYKSNIIDYTKADIHSIILKSPTSEVVLRY